MISVTLLPISPPAVPTHRNHKSQMGLKWGRRTEVEVLHVRIPTQCTVLSQLLAYRNNSNPSGTMYLPKHFDNLHRVLLSCRPPHRTCGFPTTVHAHHSNPDPAHEDIHIALPGLSKSDGDIDRGQNNVKAFSA